MKKRNLTKLHASWWTADDDRVGQEIASRVDTIRKSQSLARTERLAHMIAYGGVDKSGNYRGTPTGFFTMADDARRIRFNLMSACVDTAASRVGTLKPTPRFQTNNADYGTFLRARKLSRALEGQFHDLRVYELMSRAFVDGAVAQVGIIFGYNDPETGKPVLERVLPQEIVVDENECANGSSIPRNIYRYHLVDREVLCDLYPKREDDIIGAPGPSSDDQDEFFLAFDSKADQVVVIEAWHLKTSRSGGRHSIVTADGKLLFDEDWNEDEFPFAFYNWKRPLVGFLGTSICEEVAAQQARINTCIRTYTAMQDKVSKVYVMVREGSNVRAQKLNALNLIRYTGVKPDFETVTATPPDLAAEVDRITQQTMQQLGLSPGGMQGTREPGITSGIALQTLDDFQSQRHKMNAQLFEAFAMDVARLLIRLNDKAYELDPDYSLSTSPARGRSTFASLRWDDIRVDVDDVRITCQPVSALPSTPAGRTDMVEKWLQMGAISMQDAMQQLDFPDTGEAIRRAMVDFDYAQFQVEKILDGESFVEPSSTQNLSIAAQVVRTERLFAEMDGAPEEVLLAMDDFLAAIKSAMPKAPEPPSAPMDESMMMAPEGAGVTPMV